jgi:hypothetical protein
MDKVQLTIQKTIKQRFTDPQSRHPATNPAKQELHETRYTYTCTRTHKESQGAHGRPTHSTCQAPQPRTVANHPYLHLHQQTHHQTLTIPHNHAWGFVFSFCCCVVVVLVLLVVLVGVVLVGKGCGFGWLVCVGLFVVVCLVFFFLFGRNVYSFVCGVVLVDGV